jgi:opacity protein-like surface antigen
MSRVRKLVPVCLLLTPVSAFGQDKPTAIYAFVSNPGFTRTHSGDHWDGGLGVALQRNFTPRMSGELSVARETDVSGFTTFDSSGKVIEDRTFIGHSTAVDLTALYHFATDSAWKPYIGGGVRWRSVTAADVTGGVLWQFHRTLGLRFDGKLVIGNQSRFDDRLIGSAGLSWRF